MENNNTKRIAIIPARGGSKRILGKNLRSFFGKPIISYSIKCAERSSLFEKIHISTEDKDIYKVASNYGHQPDFMRPSELADDETPLIPVLKYTLEKYESLGEFFEEIMIIMACAPLVKPEDLRNAVKLFRSKPNADGVVGVCKYPTPIARSYRMNSKNWLEPEFPGKMRKRSQDLPENFFDAGQFSLFSTFVVKKSEGAGDYRNLIGYELPLHRAVDIDNEDDWALAEKLYTSEKQ